MNTKGAIVFGLGAVFALLAGLGAFFYMRALERDTLAAREAVRSFGEIVQVPVALRDIPRGETAPADAFGRMPIPTRSLPVNILRDLPPLAEGVPGYAVFADLREGQALLASDLGLGAPPDQGFVLSADETAIQVTPDNLSVMAARLPVGARADLFWTRDAGGTSETRRLGAGLRVLAVSPQAGTVLLAGLAREAALALRTDPSGRFDLLPTGATTTSAAGEVVVTEADLQDLPLVVREGAGGGAGVLPVLGTPTCTLTVVRSAERSTVEVPC